VIIRAFIILALIGCGRLHYDDERDASSPDAGPSCGARTVFNDDFSDGTPAPLFFSYVNPGLTLTEPGRVQIDFAPTVNPDTYAGYQSTTSYATEGLCATVEVLAVPNGEGSAYLKLIAPTQEVEFFEHNNVVELRTHMGTTIKIVDTLIFDAGEHRFWRLRQQAGVTYWDTSRDGVGFVEQASTTFLTEPQIAYGLGAGAFGTVTNAGSAQFDNATLSGP
jgi:hypothetical protein